MRFPSRLRISVFALAMALVCLSSSAFAQETLGGVPSTGSQPIFRNGLTGSFNVTTSPYKYLFVTGPIWVGQSNTSPNCYSIDYAVWNATGQTNQYLAELWSLGGGLIRTSGNVSIAPDAYSESGSGWIPRTSIGGGTCTISGTAFVVKIYSTSAALTPNLFIDFNTAFDTSYRTALNLYLPSGAFHRSVLTASFSFGSSAGVCATTPENSIKVSAANVFPASPVFGSFGWLNSGTASNFDTCSGNAYADLFLRSSANVSGAGKWTFVYQVPNGIYDVTVLYNTANTTAGDTIITFNGRVVVNGVVTPASNLAQVNDRINVGGNQILIGVSSASGTAVLNGIIITPVAQ